MSKIERILISFLIGFITRVTKWLMKDDINKGAEILKKTPYIKDIEFHNPITINKTKGSK